MVTVTVWDSPKPNPGLTGSHLPRLFRAIMHFQCNMLLVRLAYSLPSTETPASTATVPHDEGRSAAAPADAGLRCSR